MISSLIAGVGVPVLTQIVAQALEKMDSPVAKQASQILKKVDLDIQTGVIKNDDIEKANEHLLALKKLETENVKAIISEINTTYRAEMASQDVYIRRMRPTFGYVMAVTWGAQMLAVAYVMLLHPHLTGVVLNALSSISGIWAVGLSVLGIYVYKRSEEKKTSSSTILPTMAGESGIVKKIIENIKR